MKSLELATQALVIARDHPLRDVRVLAGEAQGAGLKKTGAGDHWGQRK
jgi:hypothetical protein